MAFALTQEDSYDDRRKLFKNIWDTAVKLEDKEANEVTSKPKVIKTLRLDEVDRFPAGKKKKQRLRNLRAVCNKLLDFCDRQDADDLFYEQMASEAKEAPLHPAGTERIPPQKVRAKVKNKFVKSKRVFSRVAKSATPKATTSEHQGEIQGNDDSRHSSPTKRHYTTFKTKLSNHHNLENVKEDGLKRRKVNKGNDKKRSVRKQFNVTPGIAEDF